ncbi:PH domain-containing protein [Simiduia aestuariiviva]|uniref:Uncharacterized protein YyaB-like PH domain-containing protein n=1 Tax=Simiduia aestuariiviva TaxID=1510459 RepID=A0A839UN14_9GAMM|nr:PH domain-containing protein [Simiduia aestuariiviva]MBB3166968.1 hypothetical protein [Simiduia aestuariiviva]
MKRFPSKIDPLIIMLVVVGLVGGLLPTLLFVDTSELAFWLTLLTMAAMVLFVGSLLLFTYYDIDGNQLTVRSGPLYWTIRISDIADITPIHTLLSGPALSLDKLQIRYENDRRLLISPKDKAQFIAAINAQRRLA